MASRVDERAKPGSKPKAAAKGAAKGGGGAAAGAPSATDLAVAAMMAKGECTVGTYKDLVKKYPIGDNMTPHHIPSNSFMAAKVAGYTKGAGISIMVEQPTPGTGGRHRDTESYGRSPDLSLTPKQALEREVEDLRQIYKDEGLYNEEVEKKLQDVIEQNKKAWPGVFA